MRTGSLVCASIGYQRRTIAEFCCTLADHGVELLVDVRAAAWSNRPEYRKQALAASLRDHEIEYMHCKVAGNPFRPRKGEKVDPALCEELYARHLEENPQVLDVLMAAIKVRFSALFCYESNREDCHRGVLLAALQQRCATFEVLDL